MLKSASLDLELARIIVGDAEDVIGTVHTPVRYRDRFAADSIVEGLR